MNRREQEKEEVQRKCGGGRRMRRLLAWMLCVILVLGNLCVPEYGMPVQATESGATVLEEPEVSAENILGKEAATEQNGTGDAGDVSGNDIASGTYENITWRIDAGGKLTVEGTGEFSATTGRQRAPWYNQSESITSAVVRVMGLKDASYMFYSCSNLTNMDVSGFNTSSVTNMGGMFYSCESLESLDVSGFDTSSVTNMGDMFAYCRNLESLDVSGFNTSRVTRMDAMFAQCNSLISLDVSGFDTSSVTDMQSMFNNCCRLTELDVSGFDTSKVGLMFYMFSYCSSLTSLDVSGFDTSSVTNMGGMFRDCSSLTSLDVSGFDTSSVTDMVSMFPGCSGLTSLDVSGFDTSSVTNMGNMFSSCSGLISLDVSGFDTSSVTSMRYMFSSCRGLTSLDVSGFDTSRVSNMAGMFSNCSKLMSLELSGFDTSSVTNMGGMFYSCESLESLDVGGFDTSSVKDMEEMFSGCSGLTSLNISSLDTSNVTSMVDMFYGCSGLTSLNVGSLDTSNVTDMGEMFAGCSSLTSLDVSGLDTSSVTDMMCMFKFCSGLTSLNVSGLDTSNVTDMREMFYGCSGLIGLDVSGFDTSDVTNMAGMFYGCSTLTSLNVSGFDTSHVTNMGDYNDQGMFEGCSGLMSLDVSNFDASNVTDMWWMFSGCSSLTSLDVSGFDLVKVKHMRGMFSSCDSLATLYTPYNVPTLSGNNSATLPTATWYDIDGNTDTKLPEGLDHSIVLAKNTTPDAMQAKLTVRLTKKSYEQGSEINPKDLIVKHRGTDGKTVILSLKGTNGADNGYTLGAVDMNTLGEKKVTVSYNNGITVLTKDVSFTVVEKSAELTKPDEEGSHSGSDKPSESESSGDGSDKPSGSESSGDGSDKPGGSEDSDKPGESEGSGDGSDKTKVPGLHVTFTSGKIFTYTGSSITPEIVVTNNGETLTEGVDYTLKYSNNTKAGTAKVTVIGKGIFTGRQDSEFTITRKSLKDEDIAVGSLIVAENSKAVPIIYYNGMKLGNKDYTLEGDTGKLALNAASPSIKVTGKGNYKDEITIKIKVVAKSDLKKFAVTLGKEKLVYNGKPQQPTLNIVDKGNPEKKFTEGTDYRLVFNNSHTNAGTVKVTVIGLGEYSGAVTKSYKIQPRKAADADMTVTGIKAGYPYTSAGVTFNASVGRLTVKYADSTGGMKADLVEGKDYKISYSANKKAGTAKYTISFLGNYKGSKAKKGTFTITPATLNDSTVSVVVPDKIYTGKKNAYKSVPIVVDTNGNVLKKSDYTVNYYADAALTKEIKGKDNLIELGDSQKEADVYVKITGKGNYAGNTAAFAKGAYQVKRTGENVFDLSKAKVTFKQGGNTVKKLEYTGLPIEPEVTVTVKVKGVGDITLDPSQYDITWAGNTNKGKATAVITGNGTQVKGYAFVGSKNATISIVSKDLKNAKNLFEEAISKTLKGMFARPQPTLNAF